MSDTTVTIPAATPTPDPVPVNPIPRDPSHCMVDIETLGTDPYSPVIGIGAYAFNMDTPPGEGEVFYLPITLKSNFEAGLRPSASTICWWMQQSDAARTAAFNNPEAVPLPMALDAFTTFLNSRPLKMWGNSARFDQGLMEAAYKACGKQIPWKFWDEMCYRTIKNLPGAKAIELKRVGVYHHALDDSISQAQHLQAINQALQLHL